MTRLKGEDSPWQGRFSSGSRLVEEWNRFRRQGTRCALVRARLSLSDDTSPGDDSDRFVPTPRKKTADRAKAAPPAPSRVGSALLAVWRPSVLLPLSLMLAAAITGPALIRWLPRVDQRADYAATAAELRLPPANRWVPADFSSRIWKAAGLPDAVSSLDPRLTEHLASALAASPWVRDLREIRCRREGTITAQLTYREPALLLRTLQGFYPLDQESVLLPPGDFAGVDLSSLPVARGVRSLPQGPAGKVWDDPIIAGAIALAGILTTPGEQEPPLWEQLRLEAIQLPRSDFARPALHELTYEVTTKNGSRIIWGHPPGAETLEPPPEQKLARLRYYVERHGGFGESDAPTRIDIRPLDVILAEPLMQATR